MPLTRSRALSAVAALAAVAVLTGCGTQPSRPLEDYSGEPNGIEAPASSAGGASWAVWLEDGSQLAIVLYGSSTCPPKVQNVTAADERTIRVTLAPAPGGICTHDFVAHTTVFGTPDTIAKTGQVKVVLPDTTLTLPSRQG